MSIRAIPQMLSVAALLVVSPATAQEAPDQTATIKLELNNAEDNADGACQLTILTENATGDALERAAWQMAIFDKDGRVRALPVVDFGMLPAGKTKLVSMAMPGRSCDQIARIVVNDVAECRLNGDFVPDLCLTRLTTASLVDIDFGI